MIKILTYINAAALVVVKGAMPAIPTVPKMTGGASLQAVPFKR